jgi:tripartite-type tricarboxylate transporter receptor subunit TctC
MSAPPAVVRRAILAIALLAQAGVPLVHVPYRGAGPAVADALGGQIQATIVTLPPPSE